MPINLTPNLQTQQPMGAVTPVTPYDPRTANSVAGYNGALGNGLQPLVQALMKQRLNNLLTGKLPGTTAQSVGMGTGASDFSTGPQSQPLSLGQAPNSMLG